jgi:hypothetical protein
MHGQQNIKFYKEMFQNLSVYSVHSLTFEMDTSQMGVPNVPHFSVLYPKQHILPIIYKHSGSDLLQ